jgi:phage FluMu gp28-like protein
VSAQPSIPWEPAEDRPAYPPAPPPGQPGRAAAKFRSPRRFLLPYQLSWISDTARFKIGLWARQTGKSTACAAEAVLDSVLNGGTEWIILSAGERQALEFMRKARRWANVWKYSIDAYTEDRGYPEALISRAEITWSNGSRMLALPANPETARGYSANLILDEFAFHERPDEIWRAIYPSISNPLKGKMKLRIVSTPNGKANKFYDLWQQSNRYSKHTLTLRDAISHGLAVDIEELRAGLDDPDGWAQEYECQFIDTASVLLPYELITGCESNEASESHPSISAIAAAPGATPLYCGIDIGRKRDLTVCWTLQRLGDVLWTREVLTLEKMEFHQQMEILLPRARAAGRTAIDATGIGAMLAEELARRAGAGRVESCAFTPSFKLEIFPPLRRSFEEKTIRVPISRAIREDLHGVQRIASAAGNIRYQAAQTEDGHSDRATALALALRAALQGFGAPASQPSFRSRGDWQADRRSPGISI